METTSTEFTSIWHRNDIEKSTWRTYRYFFDFESRIHVEISESNRCHNFHVDSPYKIDVISTFFPRGISTSNRWRIDEDVPIGIIASLLLTLRYMLLTSTISLISFYRAVFNSTLQFFSKCLWLCLEMRLCKLSSASHSKPCLNVNLIKLSFLSFTFII